MHRLRRFNTDPHPGNYLLMHDGRMAFVDFGSTRAVSAEWLAAGDAAVAAAMDGDPDAHFRAAEAMGYFHRPERIDRDWLLKSTLTGMDWVVRDESVRIDQEYVARVMAAMLDPSPEAVRLARSMRVPPEEIWFRRMSVSLFAVLGHLRASANWHRVAREYVFGDEPRTELGRAEREFFARSGRA
jgi:predicted unusual protein kinase regulating ubiquinone biosynthesis (AarF/ABC1/UbiB family)